jgi:hypothetical protein
MADTRIYQIFYDQKTRDALDPGFIPLDNLANERPDWREYWPVREFLLGETLVEDRYYGFFSPKFRQKTNLGSEQVNEFIDRSAGNADVVIFSPFFDVSALFLNVFEQGDRFHPGLSRTTQDLVDRIGLDVSIEKMVTDSRNTVFCNYFVAKPAFWAKWLELNEKLFEIAECASADDDLGACLNAVARIREGRSVQMKVFVMERIASLILATDRTFSSRAYSPFLLGASTTPYRNFSLEAVISDALKISLVEQNYSHYRDAFYHLRKTIAAAIGKNA